jgi:plasmid maintenance system antidote protein VapI
MGRRTMNKRSQNRPLSEQLRKLILEHELSRYAICKAARVDPGQMHRFINGTGRLTTDSLDRIGNVLGLRFVIDQ